MAGAVVTVAGMRSVADILGPVFLALMLTVTASPLEQPGCAGAARRPGRPRRRSS